MNDLKTFNKTEYAHGWQQVLLKPHSPGFDLDLGLLSMCKFCACSPRFCVGFLWVHWFPLSLQKHANRYISCAKLPLHAALWLPGIPPRVYSHLMPRVPWIGSGSIMTLARIKHFKSTKDEWMNEGMNVHTINIQMTYTWNLTWQKNGMLCVEYCRQL